MEEHRFRRAVEFRCFFYSTDAYTSFPLEIFQTRNSKERASEVERRETTRDLSVAGMARDDMLCALGKAI
jgi:hypothetical protein